MNILSILEYYLRGFPVWIGHFFDSNIPLYPQVQIETKLKDSLVKIERAACIKTLPTKKEHSLINPLLQSNYMFVVIVVVVVVFFFSFLEKKKKKIILMFIFKSKFFF